MLTVMWVKVRMCRNVFELACGRGEIFFLLFILFLCTCVCDSVCACRGVVVNLKCSTFLAVISEYSTVSVIFPLSSLLCSLYWPCDPLSSLESSDSCLDLGPETGRLQHV